YIFYALLKISIFYEPILLHFSWIT
ncbi:hypothetical protein, partial [Plasmodium yoelii yoelii]